MPTERIRTMSSANEASASASSTARSPGLGLSTLPPYLTTTTLPQNRRMYGSDSTSTEALSPGHPGPRGARPGAEGTHEVVRFSSMYP